MIFVVVVEGHIFKKSSLGKELQLAGEEISDRYPHVEDLSSVLSLNQQIIQPSSCTGLREAKFPDEKNELSHPFIRHSC